MAKIDLKFKTFVAVLAFSLVLVLIGTFGIAVYSKVTNILKEENDGFNRRVSAITASNSSILVGQSRSDVERIVGLPPDHFSFNDQDGRVTWHWVSQNHIGGLNRVLFDTPQKGFVYLSVTFSSSGSVEQVYLGDD